MFFELIASSAAAITLKEDKLSLAGGFGGKTVGPTIVASSGTVLSSKFGVNGRPTMVPSSETASAVSCKIFLVRVCSIRSFGVGTC